MGSFSNYAENAALNHLVRNSAYSPVATIYLALCTADPTDAGTGASMSEVANSGSYARTAITFGAAASRRITASSDITFIAATGSWGTVSHWAIVDSGTYGAGNMLAYGAMTTSKSVVSGNTPVVTGTSVYVEATASTGLSNYAANGFLDRMFRNQAMTVSANYCGLATASIADTTTGATVTEVSGGSYARTIVNANGGGSPAWGVVSGGSVTNGDIITFASASASWGTVTYGFIADALTVGNILFYYDVTDQAVASGDTVRHAASGLTLTCT